jgi:DNA-directed RNA polymerase alpha subunit
MGADYGLVMQPEFVNLSPRARNALRGDGINTLDQIKEMTEVELLKIPGIGRGTAEEILLFAGRTPSWKEAPDLPSVQAARIAMLELSIAGLSKENERLWKVIEKLCGRQAG